MLELYSLILNSDPVVNLVMKMMRMDGARIFGLLIQKVKIITYAVLSVEDLTLKGKKMICLIASSKLCAQRWAKSQHLRDDEWFFPRTITELYQKKDFHVILVLDGIEHVSNAHVNNMLTVAWQRGRMK